jgi:hypothetical protein
MGITGLGIGPAFAIFTLVVQNNVPVHELGTGTSSVTLFQQVGGTVGLAVTGSIFGSVLLEEIPNQMEAVGVPAAFADQFAAGGASSLNQLSGLGDLGAAILAQVPPAFQAQVEPFIPAIVSAIHTAFSIATSATFSIGVVTSVLAAAVVLVWMPGGRMGATAEATSPSTPARDPEASD